MTAIPDSPTEALVQARAQVEEIRSLADDDEAAHSREDDLREWVLEFIAKWSGDPISELADVALSTSDIDFARWCA